MLSVIDSGIGMDEKTLSRIFEPFFTTKCEEGRTGLGLSTVHGIIKQSGGYIAALSAPNKGTAIEVYFPMFLEKQIEETKIDDNISDESNPGGTESILLVDDSVTVRRVVKSIIAEAGYNVFEAENGEDAVNFLNSFDSKIDLLITDLSMPKMNGIELAKYVKSKFHEVKIIYLSGYFQEQIFEKELQLDKEIEFLKKPCRSEVMLATIRKLLDGK